MNKTSIENIKMIPNNHAHIIVPIMCFAIGFPTILICVLCLIQRREKRRRRELMTHNMHVLPRNVCNTNRYVKVERCRNVDEMLDTNSNSSSEHDDVVFDLEK
jgi:hypothetical protein